MFKNLTAAVAILSALGATPVAADQTADVIGALIGGAIIGGIVANNNHRHVQRVPDAYVYDARPRYYEVERPRHRVSRYYSSPNCVMVGVYYDRYGNEFQEYECR